MPHILSVIRNSALLLAVSAALTGCGSGEEDSGNIAEVEMRDMEMVDGTINDAMTDLDGVQMDGTAMDANGSNVAEPGNGSVPSMPNAQSEAGSAADDGAEVVSEQ